jgi:RNA polymerase sigma-70 factor (ECF subfamily)
MKAANVEFLHQKKQERQSDVPDENLLYACEVGELEALGLLFERHREVVYRFLARLAGTNAQDLDDLVQMTFLQVQKSARKFRGKSSVKSWILGISANVAKHYIRTDVRRKKAIGAYGETLRDSAAGPCDQAEHGELLRKLSEAVEELPYKLRVVFVLCGMEGYSGSEAAKVLGIPTGTARRRLHESRKRLKRAFDWSDK